MLVALGLPAEAQEAKKVPRIGRIIMLNFHSFWSSR
jgi:hypothetical protein